MPTRSSARARCRAKYRSDPPSPDAGPDMLEISDTPERGGGVGTGFRAPLNGNSVKAGPASGAQAYAATTSTRAARRSRDVLRTVHWHRSRTRRRAGPAGYLEVAPDLERFFVMGTTDDESGISLTMAVQPGTSLFAQMLAFGAPRHHRSSTAVFGTMRASVRIGGPMGPSADVFTLRVAGEARIPRAMVAGVINVPDGRPRCEQCTRSDH